jgi:hypothetical protein
MDKVAAAAVCVRVLLLLLRVCVRVCVFSWPVAHCDMFQSMVPAKQM